MTKTVKRVEAVLFDLDGTILDTNELIIQSFMHALKNNVSAEFGREQIIPHMGLTLQSQLAHFSGQADVAGLTQAYREYMFMKHDEMVSLFPGVFDTVARLREAGIPMGIVTTKIRMTTLRALEMFGLAGSMATVVSLDDVRHAKPHPEPVEKAIREIGVSPAATLMVGDSAVDMQAALAAGAVPVGVAWSLKGEQTLFDAGAVHMLRRMDELPALCGLAGTEK